MGAMATYEGSKGLREYVVEDKLQGHLAPVDPEKSTQHVLLHYVQKMCLGINRSRDLGETVYTVGSLEWQDSWVNDNLYGYRPRHGPEHLQ